MADEDNADEQSVQHLQLRPDIGRMTAPSATGRVRGTTPLSPYRCRARPWPS